MGEGEGRGRKREEQREIERRGRNLQSATQLHSRGIWHDVDSELWSVEYQLQ